MGDWDQRIISPICRPFLDPPFPVTAPLTMTILRVVRDWDEEAEVLHRKARKVRQVDGSIQELLADMVETMRESKGVGLAAPQVGRSLRAIVVEYPEDDQVEDSPLALYRLLNPEILRQKGEIEDQEGCLSLPGLLADVKRAEHVTVRGLDVQGQEVRIKASGWLARIFQHEIDHTRGVMMLDRATQVYRVETDEEGETVLTPLALD